MLNTHQINLAQGLQENARAYLDASEFARENRERIIALAQALATEEIENRDLIASWVSLNRYVSTRTLRVGHEEFHVLFLDKKNQLIAAETLNAGTVDHAPVYPREIVKRALLLDASAVIITHNHPSGDPTPSGADIDMTRQVIAALKTVNILVHDHVIAGFGGEILSFKAKGLI